MNRDRDEAMDSPLFIGGLMKSGTSLVRKLLSQHPHIFGGFETHWFEEEVLHGWKDIESRRQRWNRELYEIPEDEFEEIVSSSSSGPGFLDAMMTYCAAREGKHRWVEKTPDNVLHLPLIRLNWPDAQFVYVVRDLRDVWTAQRRKQVSFNDFLDSTSRHIEALDGLLGSETEFYIEIHYESVVTDAEKSMRTLLDRIGEPWLPELSDYKGDPSEFRRILDVTGKESSTARSLSKPIFSSKIGEWRHEISENEATEITRRFERPMRMWGYLD